MNPKFLTFLLFAVNWFLSHGQADALVADIKIGDLFKNDKREIPIDFVGEDSTYYYILYAGGRFGNGDKSLRKFNKNLVPVGDEIALEVSSDLGKAVKKQALWVP
nr:hypothetical protein [Allomuricauda sp.]